MISTQSLISLFRQALEEKWGYIWGTSGVKWTAALQKELEKTTDADRSLGRQYGKKWIGHTVADCSGLFSWAFKRLGGYMYHGSDTMYRKYCADKGELVKGRRADGGALKPGTAVFVWNGKNYSHVGLYTGDNTVIEAMGTINGVTTTKVTAGKWTHWGELAGVDYNTGNSEFRIHNSELKETGKQTIRRGVRGEDVRAVQTMLDRLGYDLGAYGVDGDFGKDTEAALKRFQSDHGLAADGVCGPATYATLKKAAAVPARYTVTVPGLDRRTAEEIAGKYGGTVTEE